MYENVLKQTGLTEKQAKIYLACLELGQAKAPEIAKKAEIKRTTAYGILDELVSLGLINYSQKNKQKFYRPNDPDILADIMDKNQANLTQLLPGLQDLFATHHLRPKIQFFEGVTGIKQIYQDALRCQTKKIYQIVKVKAHTELLGEEFILDYIRKRVASGITTYDLHPKSGDIYTEARGRENPKLKRYVRYLPPNIFYAAMIMIYDNKVAMASSKKESFGFIIESKEFTNTLKAYFDFMWKLGSNKPEIN